jgi:Protein of unknown function (DUF1761)
MKINYLAVICCLFINMLLGMAWYSAFDKPWMEGNGLTMDMINNAPNPAMKYITSMVIAVICGLVISLIFQRLGVTGWQDGAKSGAAIGFLGLLSMIMNYGFAMRPFTLGLIDGGFLFVLFTLFGALLGGWQKKA